MKIYLDLNRTLVENIYPNLGRCNFGCMEVIKKLQDSGHDIFLNSECEKEEILESALQMLNEYPYMFIQDRRFRDEFELKPIYKVKEKIQPSRWDWNEMKSTNIIFIDDNSFNIPLKPTCMTDGHMVDWDELDKQFIEHKIY